MNGGTNLTLAVARAGAALKAAELGPQVPKVSCGALHLLVVPCIGCPRDIYAMRIAW